MYMGVWACVYICPTAGLITLSIDNVGLHGVYVMWLDGWMAGWQWQRVLVVVVGASGS